MTTSCKAESEHEDKAGKGTWVKSAQVEENNEIKHLGEQTAQLQMVIQKLQEGTASSNSKQLCNGNKDDSSNNSLKGNGNSHMHHDKCNYNRIQCYCCEGLGHMACECPRVPLDEKWG